MGIDGKKMWWYPIENILKLEADKNRDKFWLTVEKC